MADYYSIWTQVGLNKQAQAEQTGIKIPITHMAVGDGGGSDVTPDETMTALVHENGRYAVELIYIDPENPNWAWVEAKIPMDAGPWWIREVGLIDAAGDLVVIANYPAVLKPTLAQGAGKDLYVRVVLAMENTALIEITADPSVVMASRAYVDGAVSAINQQLGADRRRAYHYALTI